LTQGEFFFTDAFRRDQTAYLLVRDPGVTSLEVRTQGAEEVKHGVRGFNGPGLQNAPAASQEASGECF